MSLAGHANQERIIQELGNLRSGKPFEVEDFSPSQRLDLVSLGNLFGDPDFFAQYQKDIEDYIATYTEAARDGGDVAAERILNAKEMLTKSLEVATRPAHGAIDTKKNRVWVAEVATHVMSIADSLVSPRLGK